MPKGFIKPDLFGDTRVGPTGLPAPAPTVDLVPAEWANLEGARADKDTVWPVWFYPVATGVIFED